MSPWKRMSFACSPPWMRSWNAHRARQQRGRPRTADARRRDGRGRLNRILAANVTSAFLCAKEAIRRMSMAYGGRGGAIVNLSSAAPARGSGRIRRLRRVEGRHRHVHAGLAREVAAEASASTPCDGGHLHRHPRRAATGRVDRIRVPCDETRRPSRGGGERDPVLLADEASYTTGAFIDVTAAVTRERGDRVMPGQASASRMARFPVTCPPASTSANVRRRTDRAGASAHRSPTTLMRQRHDCLVQVRCIEHDAMASIEAINAAQMASTIIWYQEEHHEFGIAGTSKVRHAPRSRDPDRHRPGLRILLALLAPAAARSVGLLGDLFIAR